MDKMMIDDVLVVLSFILILALVMRIDVTTVSSVRFAAASEFVTTSTHCKVNEVNTILEIC